MSTKELAKRPTFYSNYNTKKINNTNMLPLSMHVSSMKKLAKWAVSDYIVAYDEA
jgi:hypothetical protein